MIVIVFAVLDSQQVILLWPVVINVIGGIMGSASIKKSRGWPTYLDMFVHRVEGSTGLITHRHGYTQWKVIDFLSFLNLFTVAALIYLENVMIIYLQFR